MELHEIDGIFQFMKILSFLDSLNGVPGLQWSMLKAMDEHLERHYSNTPERVRQRNAHDRNMLTQLRQIENCVQDNPEATVLIGKLRLTIDPHCDAFDDD